MLRTVTMKLYLTDAQEATLTLWLRECCRFYNKALEQRIKAYKRRGRSPSFHDQCVFLTSLRERIPSLKAVPVVFARDALRRLDRAFDAFFRRIKAKQKPGFPRFRSHRRYNSLEVLASGTYVRPGDLLRIPKLGLVKFRAGDQHIIGREKILRIIRRISAWYAQVLVDDGLAAPATKPATTSVGIDVGLASFATLSTGEKIENPRFLRRSEKKLKAAQRRVWRCRRKSRNHAKAIKRLARTHERIAEQRKDFAHRQSRLLVNRFDAIGVEKLNVRGLARTRLAKSIHDAAWSMFTRFIAYKAAYAGKQMIAVDPRGTSQECPWCGTIVKKELSERSHQCHCRPGTVIDRDEAAAMVIHSRALGVAGACGGSGRCAAHAGSVSQPDETESRDSATHCYDTTLCHRPWLP